MIREWLAITLLLAAAGPAWTGPNGGKGAPRSALAAFIRSLPTPHRTSLLQYLSGRIDARSFEKAVTEGDPSFRATAEGLAPAPIEPALAAGDFEFIARLEHGLQVLASQSSGSKMDPAGLLGEILLQEARWRAMPLADEGAAALSEERRDATSAADMAEIRRTLTVGVGHLFSGPMPQKLSDSDPQRIASAAEHLTIHLKYWNSRQPYSEGNSRIDPVRDRYPALYSSIIDVVTEYQKAGTYAEFAAAMTEFYKGLFAKIERADSPAAFEPSGSVGGYIENFRLSRDSLGSFAKQVDRMAAEVLRLTRDELVADLETGELRLGKLGKVPVLTFLSRLYRSVNPPTRLPPSEPWATAARGKRAIEIFRTIADMDFLFVRSSAGFAAADYLAKLAAAPHMFDLWQATIMKALLDLVERHGGPIAGMRPLREAFLAGLEAGMLNSSPPLSEQMNDRIAKAKARLRDPSRSR